MSEFPSKRRQRLSRAIERNGGPVVCLLLAVVLVLGLAGRLASVAAPETPSGDAKGYLLIAASLYEHQRFSPPDHREHRELLNPDIYSPGLPFLLAGVYALTGGVRPMVGLAVIAVLGAGAIWFTFRIGARAAGPGAGLAAAAILAGYPYLLEVHRWVLTEPLSVFSLSAAVLALLWARERRTPWAWVLPGLLLGAQDMIRPEYLAVAGAWILVVLLTVGRERGVRSGAATVAVLAAALLAVIAPWIVRNLGVHGRVVPLSTGGGKALFIGTYLPGGGTNTGAKHRIFKRPDVREFLQGRYGGTGKEVFDEVYMDEMLEFLVSKSHPELPFDQAMKKMALENLRSDLAHQPGPLLAMFARKVWIMWQTGWGPRRSDWTAFHRAALAMALLGLMVLAWRRRWEALVLAVPIFGITAIGMFMLPSERRVLSLFPAVAALAGVGCVEALGAARGLLIMASGRGAGVARPSRAEH